MLIFSPTRAVAVVVAFQLYATCATAQDVTIATSRPCYAVGDTVSFIVSNHTQASIFLPRSPGWRVFDDETDCFIAPPFAFDTIVPVAGNSAITSTWPQRRYYDGGQVHAARYRVEATYSAQMNPWLLLQISATFHIAEECSPTGVSAPTWSATKLLYREPDGTREVIGPRQPFRSSLPCPPDD